ncbi:MaoC/PaaZ C-terminal domain-containing protein [Chelatococcus reniformis]|uniref:MaoC family dehydratase n=1 Tax=Chelatococcus reniformis TaxID=1494448 RepID=A0A916UUU0_9HYPH|nr:MaoC/PaaZ C-terminal domain-containing protein [Chelatococcus reniformis]GGC89532.1 MaoC family dehydratase [Chelatococcus reniformis]
MHTLFFDDFEIGQEFVSPGRTVTDTDLSLFCMLSGDWHPIHSDEEFARTTPFGRRIVGGVFGIALVTGMMGRWGIFERSVEAMLSIDDWRFLAPIFVGDTLTVRMTIMGKKPTSDGRRGVLDRGFTIVNQAGSPVQEGRSAALIKRRDE